jgi:uncharacterized protein YndB with AHSA1/START domain
MAKMKFVKEYEINASPKLLFQYFSTASGLSEWIADNVNMDKDKNFVFEWDNEKHAAKLVHKKDNHTVKFEFLEDDGATSEDPCYMQLDIALNALTETVFVTITDYSDIDDEVELNELWDYSFGSLKQIIGG